MSRSQGVRLRKCGGPKSAGRPGVGVHRCGDGWQDGSPGERGLQPSRSQSLEGEKGNINNVFINEKTNTDSRNVFKQARERWRGRGKSHRGRVGVCARAAREWPFPKEPAGGGVSGAAVVTAGPQGRSPGLQRPRSPAGPLPHPGAHPSRPRVL